MGLEIRQEGRVNERAQALATGTTKERRGSRSSVLAQIDKRSDSKRKCLSSRNRLLHKVKLPYALSGQPLSIYPPYNTITANSIATPLQLVIHDQHDKPVDVLHKRMSKVYAHLRVVKPRPAVLSFEFNRYWYADTDVLQRAPISLYSQSTLTPLSPVH